MWPRRQLPPLVEIDPSLWADDGAVPALVDEVDDEVDDEEDAELDVVDVVDVDEGAAAAAVAWDATASETVRRPPPAAAPMPVTAVSVRTRRDARRRCSTAPSRSLASMPRGCGRTLGRAFGSPERDL
jgi:hypothetical protein